MLSSTSRTAADQGAGRAAGIQRREEGNAMDDVLNAKGLCSVCHEAMTTVHAEGAPGATVFLCEKCLESAKQNFIWICLGCANVYIRPKSLVLARLKDPELRKAYQACAELQIVQGIDRCVECDPGTIVEYVAAAKSARPSGSC